MEIALITIWHEKNFGAELQCYATVRALNELGHEVEVIDFRLSDQRKKAFRNYLKSFIELFSPESRNFKCFWKKNIPSSKHYSIFNLEKGDFPKKDLYLIGSDQVWNLNLTKDYWGKYFLDFLHSSHKRASYASSIGEDTWQWREMQDRAKKLLSKFNTISVREENARKILQDTFSIASKVVLDPTLLHNDYSEIVRTGKQKRTLIYYPLNENTELSDFAHNLAKELNLKFIDVNSRTWIGGKGRITWRRTTIEEWIQNIGEASLVITPSFHGLAFSLIYQRQFLIIQSSNSPKRSSRIIDLLTQLGLQNRYFDSIESARNSREWEIPIDYSVVMPKLEILRNDSWEYLRNL